MIVDSLMIGDFRLVIERLDVLDAPRRPITNRQSPHQSPT
jgi:hypothetical protein